MKNKFEPIEPKVLTNEDLEKELMITLQKIEFFSNNQLFLTRNILELRHLIDKEKIKIMSEVIAEIIPGSETAGIPDKKKYSNENARNIETTRRLSEIPKVKEWNKKLDKTSEELEEVKLSVNKEDRMFKAFRSICYLRRE